MAKALGQVATRLGTMAKRRLKQDGETADVKQAARLLVTLAARMVAHVENAKLYEAFAADVPPDVLLKRLR